MDVHCSTCNEPWDVYHLWHDAVYDIGLSPVEIQRWNALPQSQRLDPPFRNHFRGAGWEFGRTLVNVVRCPCCPKEAVADAGKVETKAALEDLLGDDQDGLAATFEDYRL